MKKKIEILGPAGSKESLEAAVNCGADAVYLGGKEFNARRSATNFDDECLIESLKYAHEREKQVYIVINISLKESELEKAKAYIDFLYDIGVDGIIVQDMGIAKHVREKYPDFPIHASTQMTVNNVYGAKHLEKIGFTRIVLSRELLLKEIYEIKKSTNIELEIFIHGALCVSYSGQCLMSSLIGGRSGNRGTCAQTCRMPFKIEKDGNTTELDDKYLLSLKDLSGLEYVEELMKIGVTSLKIEGRMKKPEYVGLVVGQYRQAVDEYINGVSNMDFNKAREDMGRLFNRGFTKGFLGGDFGSNIVSSDKPNNRGIYLGEIEKTDKNKIYFEAKNEINLGDELLLVDNNGEERVLILSMETKNKKVEKVNKKDFVVITLKSKKIKGKEVYKIFDKDLNEKLKDMLKEKTENKNIVDGSISINIGNYPEITLKSKGIEIKYTGDKKIEESLNRPVTVEMIEEQFSKLGGTAFKLGKLDINLEEKSFLSLKDLNMLRREGIEKLENSISQNKKQKKSLAFFKEKPILKERLYNKTTLTAKVEKTETLRYLDTDKLSRVYLPTKEESVIWINSQKIDKEKTFIYLERITENNEFEKLSSLIKKVEDKIEGVLVNNIGQIEFLNEKHPNLKILADYGFNVYNSKIVEYLELNNLESITLSPELNFDEIEEIIKNKEYIYEALGYGYLEVMVTKNCPYASIKKCKSNRDCTTCEFSEYNLIDRKDFKFRTKRENGVTKIYNSQALYIPESLEKIKDIKISNIRLEFTVEKEEAGEILDIYSNALLGKINREYILDKKAKYTRGHYFRGVE